MAALVDTNVLVYRFDAREPAKQRKATELLRAGLRTDTLHVAHQAIVEFVAVVSRQLPDGKPLLAPLDARREAEELISEFNVLYPSEDVLRLALWGAAAYQLAWYDAHTWGKIVGRSGYKPGGPEAWIADAEKQLK